jgi:hypothetical protein
MRALSLTSPAFVAAISLAKNTFVIETLSAGKYGTVGVLAGNYGVQELAYDSNSGMTSLTVFGESKQYDGYSVAFIGGNWVFTTNGSSAANPAIVTINDTTRNLSFFGSSYLSFSGDIFNFQSLVGQTVTFAISF